MNILDAFLQCGALLEGHFVLSSGLHSNRYLQCAKVLQYPDLAEAIGAGIAELFKDIKMDVVVGPAMGGVIIAQEVGRAAHVRAIFAEREQGVMTLRRGFSVEPGERAVVVEDVVTTGGSAREVADMLRARGATVVGIGAIIDRTTSAADFGVPFRALGKVEVATYKPEDCPLCKANVPVTKPGSRGLR